MSLYRPRKPSKPGALMSVWEMLFNGKFPFIDTPTVKWNKSTTGYSARAISSPGGGAGGSGWQWQTPNKELDSTVAVAKDTVVRISRANPLVTIGPTDLVSNVVTQSPPGIWIAAKDVPAQISVGTPPDDITKYNAPQLPYPGKGTGGTPPSSPVSPSGDPLAGDFDDNPNLFWILLQEDTYCLPDGTTGL